MTSSPTTPPAGPLGGLPVFLLEINPGTGAVVQNLSLPTLFNPATGDGAFLLSSSQSEGDMNSHVGGCYASAAGYDGTLATPSLEGSTVPRVAAIIDSTGGVNLASRDAAYGAAAAFMPGEARPGAPGGYGAPPGFVPNSPYTNAPDTGANARAVIMSPDGARVHIVGKAGLGAGFPVGTLRNVTARDANGPLSDYFIAPYNTFNAWCGVNMRSASEYNGAVYYSSSGSTGAGAGVTVLNAGILNGPMRGAMPLPTFDSSQWVPIGGGGASTPHGVVQADETNAFIADQSMGIVFYSRPNGAAPWALAGVDTWGASGASLGVGKVGLLRDPSGGGTFRVFGTSPIQGGVPCQAPGTLNPAPCSGALFEYTPSSAASSVNNSARFRTVAVPPPGQFFRGVTGVPAGPACGALPTPAPAPPAPVPTPLCQPANNVPPAVPAPAARFAAPFRSGNILASYSAGVGSGGARAIAVELHEICPGNNPAGGCPNDTAVVIQRVALPTVTNNDAGQGACTLTPSQSEGDLQLDPNGCYATMACYDGPTSVTNFDASTLPRSAVIIDTTGAVDVSTRDAAYGAVTAFMPGAPGVPGPNDLGANPRAVILSADTQTVWISGKAGISSGMPRGRFRNVTAAEAAAGPLGNYFVEPYNTFHLCGLNQRNAAAFNDNLLVTSSGSTGPYSDEFLSQGTTIIPRARLGAALMGGVPIAQLSAVNNGTQHGVVQTDVDNVYVANQNNGVEWYARNPATNAWTLAGTDTTPLVNGTGNFGLGKIGKLMPSQGGPATGVLFATALNTGSIYLYNPNAAVGARVTLVLAPADPGFSYRGVTGVPFGGACGPLPTPLPLPPCGGANPTAPPNSGARAGAHAAGAALAAALAAAAVAAAVAAVAE